MNKRYIGIAFLVLICCASIFAYRQWLRPDAPLAFAFAGDQDAPMLRTMTARDWDTKLRDPKISCLSMTEAEFRQLSETQKPVIQQEAIDLLNTLKPAFIWYVKEAANARNVDADKSRQYDQNAQVIAKSLLESKLDVLRQSGEFFQSILEDPKQLSE